MRLDVVAVFGALGALLVAMVGLYLANANRGLLRADASSKIADAASGLIAPLEARIDALEAQNRLLVRKLELEQRRRRNLQHGVQVLVAQLERLGMAPEWRPEVEDAEGEKE